jgi:hypothetical protein
MRLAIILVASILCGCESSPFRALTSFKNRPVELPEGRQPSLASAARVDEVGRKILAANVFSGLEVSFQTIGDPEPLLFHHGRQGLFISDSLVNRCQNEEELAAVLCSELGKMIAEQRNAVRMGYRDPISNLSFASSGEANGITGDQFRLAELAEIEKRTPKKMVDRVMAETTDPRRIAIDMMKTTGYADDVYPKAESLLRGVNKKPEIMQQLLGSSVPGKWLP